MEGLGGVRWVIRSDWERLGLSEVGKSGWLGSKRFGLTWLVSTDQTTFDFSNNNLASLTTCFIKSPVIVIPEPIVGKEIEYTG